MGFWTNLKKYIVNRLNSYVEVLAKSFGAMLIIWVSASSTGLIALVSGAVPNWGAVVATGLGGTAQFVITLLRAMFGKSYNGDEKEIK